MGTRKQVSRKKTVKGFGLVGDVIEKVGNVASSVLNKGIDLLPWELHLPGGYRYCGPGTRLRERLARGDRGINGLDEACKAHDIAYSKYRDNTNRALADKELAERAWQRFKASDSSVGEKAAAWAVTTAMKAKAKLGGGGRSTSKRKGGRVTKRKRTTKRKQNGNGLYLRPYPGSGNPKQGAGKRKKRCCSKKKKRQSR